jgi:hypothetical protein
MAQQNVGGLPFDMSQFSTIGASEDDLSALRQAQQDYIDALQQRYAQPNWWKVAAGFAKPQLGGFLASLGSAEEAMGENLEQRRAMQLPIAQAKAQIAQTNYLLNRRQKANDAISQYQSEHPNEALPASLLSQVGAYDPSNPAYAAYLKGQETSHNQFVDAKATLESLKATGQISPEQYNAGIAKLVDYLPIKINGQGQPIDNQAATTGTPQPAADNIQRIHDIEKGKGNTIHMSDDVYNNLYKDAGINVISNIRSKEENDKLVKDPTKDTQTPQGRPWTPNGGGHFEGTAIDIDPTQKLTDDQLKVLKDNGWVQNIPKDDPNHWVKQGQKVSGAAQPSAAAKDIVLSQSGASTEAQIDAANEQVKNNEKLYNNEINNYFTSYRPNVTNSREADLQSAYNYLHPSPNASNEEKAQAAKTRAAFGQLNKLQGLPAAIAGTVQNGLNINMGMAPANANINVGLDVENFLKNRADEKTKTIVSNIIQTLQKDAINDISLATKAMGGGHMNQSQFGFEMNQIPQSSNPQQLISKYILNRLADNHFHANLYNASSGYLTDPKYSDPKYSRQNFFQNYEPYKYAIKTYDEEKKAANKLIFGD